MKKQFASYKSQVAFWSYDTYPFVLWGEIEKDKKHPSRTDMVYVPSYQSFFAPFLICPSIEANDLIKELESLEAWKDEEEKKLCGLFNDRLKKVIANHPKFNKS